MNPGRNKAWSWAVQRFKQAVLVLALSLAGCMTPMDRVPDPNKPLASSEGIVVGSVLVRVGKTTNPTAIRVAPMFLVSARGLKYSVEGGVARDTKSIVEKPITLEKNFSLILAPDEEKIFVTKMRAGPHDLFRLVPRGYEESSASLGIRFTVAPGTTTYIGRVIFDLSEKLPLSAGLPRGMFSLHPSVQIEDAQEATINSIRSTHSRFVDNVVKDLMQGK